MISFITSFFQRKARVKRERSCALVFKSKDLTQHILSQFSDPYELIALRGVSKSFNSLISETLLPAYASKLPLRLSVPEANLLNATIEFLQDKRPKLQNFSWSVTINITDDNRC